MFDQGEKRVPRFPYKSDVLFIVKNRELALVGTKYPQSNSSGVDNSVRLISAELNKRGVRSNVVQVLDNNYIDREVVKYRPRIVFIEALWVIPSKFEILTRIHPDVTWVIRLHSEIPFIANEGIAMMWIRQYQRYFPKVLISANSIVMVNDLISVIKKPVMYTPNYYPVNNKPTHRKKQRGVINISCFGAIRPLKNHLTQAIAAMAFADQIDNELFFHINGTRIEQQGDPILKNLRHLFESSRHHLVEHKWLEHDEFVKSIQEQIDIGLQVSFTETFNIVAADHVVNNVPVVTSPQVKFVDRLFHGEPTSINSIVRALHRARIGSWFGIHKRNRKKLSKFSNEAIDHWVALIKHDI